MNTAALDHKALLQVARTFAETELRPVALRYDESEEYPAAPLRRAAELGLTSYDLPAAYGGGGVERIVRQNGGVQGVIESAESDRRRNRTWDAV